MARTPKDDTLTPAPSAPPAAAPEGIAVVFHGERNPGVRFIGGMRPDTAYTVPPAEAVRLVTAKGFDYASEADAARAQQFTAAAAASEE